MAIPSPSKLWLFHRGVSGSEDTKRRINPGSRDCDRHIRCGNWQGSAHQEEAARRPTLPERDAFQHSHKSAHRSITPPCQNRGPAKDERSEGRMQFVELGAHKADDVLVSIPIRPSGRMQCLRRPLWARGIRVSILIRPEGRMQPKGRATITCLPSVSILIRPEGRMQQRSTSNDPRKFT